MNEVYNGGFSSEISVSMLKKIIALVWEYVYETSFTFYFLVSYKYAQTNTMISFNTETLAKICHYRLHS